MGTATEDDKIAILTIHASDNLTDNMFKQGMWIDTQKILKGIANEKEISEIAFFWQFETVDPYGTKKVDNVMKIIFNRETIDKINFSNLIFENIPKTATTYWEHPSLKRINSNKNKSRQMTALILKLFFCINFLGETQKSASKRNRFSHYT